MEDKLDKLISDILTEERIIPYTTRLELLSLVQKLRTELESAKVSSAHKIWAALRDGGLATNLLFLTREDAIAFTEANNEACKREKYHVARVEIRVVE